MDTDRDLYVSSDSEGEPNPVFVADPQKNDLNRAIVRFGISYQELREKPTYWTIEKAMADYKDIKTKCEKLEAEVKRLTDLEAARRTRPKIDQACNTEQDLNWSA